MSRRSPEDGGNAPFESYLSANPCVGIILHASLLQFEGTAVPDVVPDVFLVDQDLVDGAAGPDPAEISQDATGIQNLGNLGLGLSIVDEAVIDLLNDGNLIGWLRDKGDAIRLNALEFTALQDSFRHTMFVDQHAQQTEARRTGLAIAELDQAALACKDLQREFSAILSSHGRTYRQPRAGR